MTRYALVENRLAGLFPIAMGVASFVIAGDWAEQDGWASFGAVGGVLLAICCVLLGLRMCFTGVAIEPEAVLVRNLLRTYRVPLDAVIDFHAGRRRRSAYAEVRVHLKDGSSVRVSALGPGPFLLFGQEPRLQRLLAALNQAVRNKDH